MGRKKGAPVDKEIWQKGIAAMQSYHTGKVWGPEYRETLRQVWVRRRQKRLDKFIGQFLTKMHELQPDAGWLERHGAPEASEHVACSDAGAVLDTEDTPDTEDTTRCTPPGLPPLI